MRLGSLGRGIFFVYVILHATGCTGTSEESEPFVKGFHNGIPVEFMGCNLRIPESFFRAAVGEYNREDSLIRLRSKPFDHAAVTSDIGVTDFESKEYGEYILHSFSVSVSEELSFWLFGNKLW